MLSENIKKLRKEKEMSQEELALRLNVVRQTVSKWEQNLSVPDSEMLIKIAEVFEVPVSRLLGERVEETDTKTELEKISQKLENLNSMIAEKSNKSRRIWLTVVAVCLIIISAILLAFSVIFLIRLINFVSPASSVAIIGGADGPTKITVSSTMSWFEVLALFAVALIIFAAAIMILRRIKK
ncbi:MAG: helix-turn-helix domain-containing protein [Clostridia bacterium]|nr:helix-turn-helix domain-containing protein [Clostridia bacterium]